MGVSGWRCVSVTHPTTTTSIKSYSDEYLEYPSGGWENYQCLSLSEKVQTFYSETLPVFLKSGWFVATSWHTGSSFHDSFHSSLFHSWTDTSVSWWLTKRSVPLRSRCAFRNTAQPASPGSVSVSYRGFWKLFTVLVKAWEDSVGTTQKLRFITTWYPPVIEYSIENRHVPLCVHQGLLHKQKLRQDIPICFLMKPESFCVTTNVS